MEKEDGAEKNGQGETSACKSPCKEKLETEPQNIKTTSRKRSLVVSIKKLKESDILLEKTGKTSEISFDTKPQNQPTTGDLPENPETIDLTQHTVEMDMEICLDFENSDPENSDPENSDPKNGPLVSQEKDKVLETGGKTSEISRITKPQNQPTTGDLPENPETIDLSRHTVEEDMETCLDFENSDPKNGPLVSQGKDKVLETGGKSSYKSRCKEEPETEPQNIKKTLQKRSLVVLLTKLKESDILEITGKTSEILRKTKPQNQPTTGDLPENPETIDLSQHTVKVDPETCTCLDFENSDSKNGPLVSREKDVEKTGKIIVESSDYEGISAVLNVKENSEPIQTEFVSSSSCGKQPKISGCLNGNSETKEKDKVHYCSICDKSTKLCGHFLAHHQGSNELVGSEIEKRQKMIDVQNKRDHLRNKEVLERGQENIKVKQKMTLKPHNIQDFLPCPDCFGYFHFKDIQFHKCVGRSESATTKGKVLSGRLLLPLTPGHVKPNSFDEMKLLELFSRLKRDPVGMIVRRDQAIHELALRETRKKAFDSDQPQYLRHKLREVARLVIIMRKLSGKADGHLVDFLKGSNLKMVLQAIRELSSYSEGISYYENPSAAKKMGLTLKRCALLMQLKAIKEGDDELRKDCEHFIRAFDVGWNEWISSFFSRTFYRRRPNGMKRLPSVRDVQVLTEYLAKCAENAKIAMQNSKTLAEKTYARQILCKALLSQVILFNRRPSADVSKMKVAEFMNRQNVSENVIWKTLSIPEQMLSKSVERVEITGKGGRMVPILLTDAMVDSFKELNATRQECGVPDTNVFVFAQNGPRYHDVNGHIRGCETLREHCYAASLEFPSIITSTNLRKFAVIMTKLFNLSENESDPVSEEEIEMENEEENTGNREDCRAAGSITPPTSGTNSFVIN